MGTVFLARDHHGRPVAVKMIRSDLAADPDFRDRFRREVAQARRVPPFCTAEILDAGPDHEPPYVVQEYVDGASLAEVIAERGPLAGGSLHSVAIGVITALAAIHDAGVVHRDLKPANVLFSLGSPKVIDFGLAKPFAATTHTGPGQIFGTLEFMAPERFGPHPAGPAADVFAWAAVVVFAATGTTPFRAGDPITVIGNITRRAPDLGPIPQPLRGLVAAALRKDPAARPTADQLLRQLVRAGAAGDHAAQPGLRPELRRAVHAVRDTALGRWVRSGLAAGIRLTGRPDAAPAPAAGVAVPGR